MYKGLTVAAVVPAYNEERLIAKTISTMPEIVDHIIVVDDCSTDATAQRAGSTGDPRVQLIRHERNMGVGGAILDGHRLAMRIGADVDVVMAGDAQMDPRHLPALLDPIADEGLEFTKGNRFYSRAALAGMPRVRIVGNIILSFATKLASGYWHLFDPQNGYTAIRRSALERLDLDRIAQRYEFENDLLINLNIANASARDVPVPAVYGEEVSDIRLHRVVPAITFLLFRGFWRRVWLKYVILSFSPVALLLFAGLAFVVAGLAVGVVVAIYSVGPRSATAGSVLLAVVPFLTGVQFLVNALVLDIQESRDVTR